jgi:malate synthase
MDAPMTTTIAIHGPMCAGYERILTPEAQAFVAKLTRAFRERRAEQLAAREARQARIDAGEMPRFLEETREIREGAWQVNPVPADLQDRRVEITGPTDRKMVINALNSGAKVYMTDFEDSNAPTWDNMIQGQINLMDAVRREISFTNEAGKHYELKNESELAVLMVRPRGWHLDEAHFLVDGEPTPAGLFDFGLFFFHNAKAQLARGTGPYFYLPKLESHLEARLWNDVFVMAQDELGIERGTIKATVLIETILATFEAEEILYELREHSAGLNCGRWDYIFSYIKKFRNNPNYVLPDRGQVTMSVPFMRNYSKYVVKVCHKRGAHAMGGMAAYIPVKADAEANQQALDKVYADKVQEAKNGHDGTWVAHPGLIETATRAFDAYMPGPNQLDKQLDDFTVTPDDLLAPSAGTITEAGVMQNLKVGIQYMAAWLGGNGCVPLYNLMEDAATAEISRTQLWQWRKHKAALDDGRLVDDGLLADALRRAQAEIRAEVGDAQFEGGHFQAATELFEGLMKSDEFTAFLTLPAYDMIRTNA